MRYYLIAGEPSGDLIVNVRVADHERFKRNGDDLYLVSDISIAQAALGCEIEVEGIMPDEVVKVTVPAGAQYGDTVSVNNYGMPRTVSYTHLTLPTNSLV